MRIVKLQSENIKRLHAVEITPDGNLITIGGKNGAGKSSVLDSIAYALGGQKLVPAEPIRKGEREAKIVVDLGDLVVTRTFTRQLIEGETGGTGHWGPTNSYLTVTNKEGAKYPSPQSVLDKLLGELTFDPLAFATDDPKHQLETLKKLLGLDFTSQDNERKAAFERRTMHNRTVKALEARIAGMPEHSGVPAEEVSLSALSEELIQAQKLEQAASEADKSVTEAKTFIQNIQKDITTQQALIEDLEQRLAKAREVKTTMIQKEQEYTKKLADVEAARSAAHAAVPDLGAIQQRLKEAEGINTKVRANKVRKDLVEQFEGFRKQAEKETNTIENIDGAKQKQLAEAKFPVPGLGLSDDGVTFNGVPFEQASSAEQLRVSVAIGLALNPKLRVLLVRNGNQLDSDSLRVLSEQAAAAEAQVWMEWVAESKDGVSVMIADGEVIQ